MVGMAPRPEAKKAVGPQTQLPDFPMVGDARLERAAFGSGDQRSIQLSYSLAPKTAGESYHRPSLAASINGAFWGLDCDLEVLALSSGGDYAFGATGR